MTPESFQHVFTTDHFENTGLTHILHCQSYHIPQFANISLYVGSGYSNFE